MMVLATVEKLSPKKVLRVISLHPRLLGDFLEGLQPREIP